MVNQLHAELITRAAGLGVDELRVLNALAERLQRGVQNYGPMNIVRDNRDFRRERDEELMDAIVYQVMEGLRKAPKRPETYETNPFWTDK